MTQIIVIGEKVTIKWIGFDDGETYVEIVDQTSCPTGLYGECLH